MDLKEIKNMSEETLNQLCIEIEYKMKHNIFDEFTKGILESLLEYGKLTILRRAFPRVEDGLKPVHRRILYTMNDLKLTPGSAHKKSARITGSVIGLYHPFGDSSVYQAMVRMAQDFSLREILIEGQGNFGTIEGDVAGSQRYTEATVTKTGGAFFKDLEKGVVPFIDNYDETTKEPIILPVKFPNLLINGTSGIAVGMTSEIPPHNPIEVINATKYIVEQKKKKKQIDIEELINIMPAPDFPTGGIIFDIKNMKEAFLTGKTKLKLRANYKMEKKGRKNLLIITEIPYMVKTSTLFNKLQEIINNKKEISSYNIFKKSISNVRNESNKDGLRITLELKSNVNETILWNQLLKACPLNETISYISNVIDINGEPKIMGLQNILESFISFRISVIIKKYEYIKNEAEKSLELILGYIKALDIMDEIIKIIRNSENEEESFNLILKKGFTERQTKAILFMRLGRLTKMEKATLIEEKKKLETIINNANKMIKSPTLKYNEIIKDLDDSLNLFKRKERLTKIDNSLSEIKTEEIIEKENCSIYFSKIGYLYKVSTSNRKKEIDLIENDYLFEKFKTNTHNSLFFITDKGNVFLKKIADIEDSNKGIFLSNLFEINENEKIINIFNVEDIKNEDLELAIMTKNGFIKKTILNQFNGAYRASGIISIKLIDDSIMHAKIINKKEKYIVSMINSIGKLIKFNLEEVPTIGRMSKGVIGMKLDNEVIKGGTITQKEEDIIITFERGIVLKNSLKEFNKQKRAGKGVYITRTTPSTGELINAIFDENIHEKELMVISNLKINKIKINFTRKDLKLLKKDLVKDSFLLEEI